MVTQKQETIRTRSLELTTQISADLPHHVCQHKGKDIIRPKTGDKGLSSQHKLTRKAYIAPSWAWNEFNDSQAQGWNQASGEKCILQGSEPTRNLGQNFQNVFRLGKTGKWSTAGSQLFPPKPG